MRDNTKNDKLLQRIFELRNDISFLCDEFCHDSDSKYRSFDIDDLPDDTRSELYDIAEAMPDNASKIPPENSEIANYDLWVSFQKTLNHISLDGLSFHGTNNKLFHVGWPDVWSPMLNNNSGV